MGWDQLWTTGGALAAVLGLALAARAVLLRTGIATPMTRSRRIRLVESLMIGPRSRVHLIDVEGRRLLVGSSEHGVSMLCDRGPVPENDAGAAAPAPSESAAKTSWSALHALLLIGFVAMLPIEAAAEAASRLVIEVPDSIAIDGRSSALDVLGLLTVLAIAPSILLMATCFTRFVIVLAFVRQAIGVQHMPPNQILIGLALFLTAFVMAPIAEEIVTLAYDPYVAGELTARESLNEAVEPLRRFMLSQTREQDVALFAELSKIGPVDDLSKIPLTTLVPSFLVSELRTAFQIGFVVFLPFLVIDLVISSLLISMGMIVLPPIVVSLPFKIMLFVLVDGWNLILGSLVQGMV